MSTQVQIRRGNTAQTAAFTGSIAELTVDTDKKVVVVHDGTTAGGNPLIKANASITTGQILTSNGSHLLALSNTGTAGTYGNASFIPVVTTDAYGRVSSVTNTAIAISSGVVTGVMTFAQGGANATSYTTGGLLTSNGTAFVSVANTGTAGTYANAAYVPVITTDAYGRVSAVTNTAVAIDTSQITSGTIADARLPTKGTAGTYANAAYVPVTTTDAYGRVTGITNTAIAIDTSQITSGTVADARLPTKGTAGTYANAAYIPVITTDAYGRVTGVTNTAVAITASQVSGGTLTGDLSITGNLTVSGTQTIVNTSTVSTNDSLLKLAANNTVGDVLDIGFYGQSNTGSSVQYHGLVRQAAGNFFLFKGIPTDPSTNTLATGSATAANTATLRANLTGGTVSSLSAAIGIADGGTNQTTFTNGIVAFNGTALATLANTGTAGVYGNAAYHPVITTDAYGRVSAVTNTLIQISTTQITSGVLPFAQGGANNTTYTTGAILTSNGTAFVALANTGTAGTYGNAAYHPVITTDAYGRVSSVTNTAVAIDTSQITSGTLADARLPATGTAGTYANASHVPVITTDSKGRVTAVTNTAIALSAAAITSGTLAIAQGGTASTTAPGAMATLMGYTSTATAAGTTTLTNTSSYYQQFTGSTTQTVQLPVTSTLTTGWTFHIVNNSTGNLTVNSSGANLVITVPAGTTAMVTCIATTTTTAADWESGITDFSTYTGSGNVVMNTSPVLTTPNIGTPSFATLTNATGLPIVGGTTGTLTIARGGTNQTTFTSGQRILFDGTSLASQANVTTTVTGGLAAANTITALTTNSYGDITAYTGAAIAIDTAQITSGTIADARLPTKGTAGTYANATHVPVITTDAYGRVTAVTNTAIAITSTSVTGVMTFAQGGANATTYTTGGLLTSNGTSFVSVANTGTAGTYANSTYIPVITTDAYGRVTAITNTVIQSSTTSVQGIVQLTDSISSTSTTTAATPNSVKTAYDLAATKFNSSGGTISGDTTITGNLVVNGTTTTVNTSTVSTSDSLLKLANNNTAGDSLDIGFYGTYNATGQKYAGLVRQAGSNFFLFKDLTTDPTSNALATGSLTASNTATLRANITGGTVSSLASAIGVADGGTGATTLTAGGILIGSGTSAVTILANTGTAGTYGNAAYHPVITTDTYGRVSGVTNTAIAIDTAAITSGTIADARLPTKGTAGTYGNNAYHPVITTDAYGRVTAVTNTLVQIAASQVTSGVLPFAQGGANNTTYTTGAILTSNGTAFVALANTGTAGTYANAAYVPVITTDAYGRVSGVTNTAIAIDTAAITSGTIADARLPTKGTAGTYGNTTYHPVITTDAYGRVTAVTNTLIQSATTSVSGIVQLTDSISSTSTTTAATPNSVKTAYDYAQSAFTKANQTAQLAFTTVSANGTSLAADANTDTLTITAATANGIFINADAATDALDIGLRNSGVTAGTYGNTTTAVTITVDAFGRITSVSNAAISAGATLGDVLALSIALG